MQKAILHIYSLKRTICCAKPTKFGNNLKSKKGTGMINEVLVKCLCHNICVLIQEMHEIGLEVNYSKVQCLVQKPIL